MPDKLAAQMQGLVANGASGPLMRLATNVIAFSRMVTVLCKSEPIKTKLILICNKIFKILNKFIKFVFYVMNVIKLTNYQYQHQQQFIKTYVQVS